ncbi:hypothetical protein V6Z11_D01G165100 [Gossypium hirsutum]|uniref:Uncharacterized protein n=1 Tax=Gossypium darwinii TaxID=34276 RepID=A0A5D2DQT4_GOSDA|nr:hypothetical protein ES288_D01G172500v1 [Gossypium darwinii]
MAWNLLCLHSVYMSLKVAFSMEATTTFTDIFDDHLSDGLSAKPQRFGEKLNWKPKLMKKRVLFYVHEFTFPTLLHFLPPFLNRFRNATFSLFIYYLGFFYSILFLNLG